MSPNDGASILAELGLVLVQLSLVLTAYGQTVQPPIAIAAVQVESVASATTSVMGLIDLHGKDLTANERQEILKTIMCESGGIAQQSRVIRKDGTREKSFGIAQIFLPAHPVTYEQAMNNEFAVKFMVNKWQTGDKRIWTCARDLGYY